MLDDFVEQRSATSWMNEGQQQWVHTTSSPVDLQQEMNVTGRLPHGASSENTAQIPNGIVYILLMSSNSCKKLKFKIHS